MVTRVLPTIFDHYICILSAINRANFAGFYIRLMAALILNAVKLTGIGFIILFKLNPNNTDITAGILNWKGN